MKPIIPFALLGALLAIGAAKAATTTPVGYNTQKIVAGQFNVIGLDMHQPTLAAGILDAVTSNSVSDTQVDFSTIVTPGTTYILEITNGSGNGIIQESIGTSGSALSLSADITSIVTPGTTTYVLREASTIADIFGAANSVGLQASANADPAEADVIYLPDGAGGFTQIFYSTADGFTGWFDTVNFADASNTPIVYTDGFVVERKGATTLDLVVSGELKKTPTVLSIDQPFTYVGGVYPAGSTFGTTNLSTFVQGSANADPAEADIFYLPDGLGGFVQYFYSTADGFTGWFDTVNFGDASGVELTPGILVERRAPAPYSATLSVPGFYSGL